jgi:hypothetical protein
MSGPSSYQGPAASQERPARLSLVVEVKSMLDSSMSAEKTRPMTSTGARGRLVANPTVLAQPLPDGAVLLDTESGNCFELNRTGAEIWKRISANEQPTAIADVLAVQYGIQRSEFLADLDRLMNELARHGLLILAR